MKKKCDMKCQYFLRCEDARNGKKCMYDIDTDDDFILNLN